MFHAFTVAALWAIAGAVALFALDACAILRRIAASLDNIDQRNEERLSLLRLAQDVPFSRPQEVLDMETCDCDDCRGRVLH